MNILKFFFTIIIACVCAVANAQSKLNFNRIGIGDEVPGHLPLMNLVNHSKANAKVADFKGKWLILDYWFTGCGPCIESWPKLMQLQKKYGDKIQIMGVNHMQNHEVVESFITKRNKNSKEPFTIPSVTGDTILFKLLPPSGYPTIVWIDPDGIYRASANGTDLNEERIEAVLKNKNNIQTLVATTTFVNPMRPLFIDGNGGTGQQMLYYSTVSKYSDKVGEGAIMSADSSGYVITAKHKPILDLIMRAYSEGGPFDGQLVYEIRLPETRIELRVKDPKRLSAHSDGRRNNDNVYTYQLITYQPRTLQQLKEIMKDDIQRYFDLEFKWEKIKKQCLVLTAEDTTLLGDNSLGKERRYAYKKDSDFMYLRDVPISNFFGYLTEYIGGKGAIYNGSDGYPLINETGFKGGLDLVFENVTQLNFQEVLSDYKKLNSALAKYKMGFKLEEREVDVLVITDAEAGKNTKKGISQ